NCFGENNGSATIIATGGTSPYSFQWSNGQTSQSASSLAAGTYTVSVTDANGCTSTGSVQVLQPSNLLASVNTVQNVDCNGGANGLINLNVSGGISPYIYSWSNGSTSQDISSLIAGTYTVTITDANGCTTSVLQNISEPPAQLSTTATVNQSVSCFGGTNGSIIVSVSGGSPSYTYNWSNGASTNSISGLTSGNYTLTVIDANGCQNMTTYTVAEPNAPLAANQINISNVSCNGGSNGSVSVSVSGGTSPYTYSWSNGATSQDLVSLITGNYSLTVTDANGCTALLNASVGQPAAPIASTTSVTQNVSCNGGSDGVINVLVSGGTAPYSYLWNNGAVTQSITGLSAGNYAVTITDANGCSDVSSATVAQPTQPINIQASVTSSISCFNGNNGTINLTINGGTAPFSYLWNNGSTAQNQTQLPAGNYTVTVTDANGCTEQSINSITQPAGALAASISVSQSVACFGGGTGTLDLSVSGGTAPYSYLWSNGETTEDISNLISGTYTVSITDVNGCLSSASGTVNQPQAPIAISIASTSSVNCFGGTDGSASVSVSGGTIPYSYLWSNGSIGNSIQNIAAGSYSVTVTDANGCTSIQSLQIIEPVQQLTSSITLGSNVSCFGESNGSLSATVLGGTAPYSYSWSNGTSNSDATALSAGTYTLTITDANGCTTSASSSVGQPVAALTTSVISNQSVSCFAGADGSISVSGNGGTAPYGYVWSNGDSGNNISGLIAGTYSVTIADANGCTATNTINIGQPASPLSAIVNSSTNVSCNGGGDGSIDLDILGGTAPYTYNWDNGGLTQDLVNLAAGLYNCIITDANGCTQSVSQAIIQPQNALSNTASVTQQVNCFNGNDGSVDLSVNGGTLPYVYSWSNGSTTEDLSGLSAGVYTV
ncbi:MAG: beta strand repeat-containing protein, partial [Bacteroidota bacterium]